MQTHSPKAVRQIPLAVPIGICLVLLLSVVTFAVYIQTYHIAIEKLKEHEVIDLRDETRKNADGLKATLTQLREDAMALGQHPAMRQLVESDDFTDLTLRNKLGEIFKGVCLAQAAANAPKQASDNRSNTIDIDEVPKWKHYMQVRLIDGDGFERVRVQRLDVDSKDVTATNPEELDENREGKFFRGDSLYFRNARDTFESRLNDGLPMRVSMSEIEFDKESQDSQPTDSVASPSATKAGRLTIQAVLPLSRFVDKKLEFRGILAINLDLEAAIKSLTSASRHLVYIGTGNASGLESATPPRLLYNPRFLDVPGSIPTVTVNQGLSGLAQFEDFRDTLRRDIETSEQEQLENQLSEIGSVDPEVAERGNNEDAVLPLADRGMPIPEDAESGQRLKLTSNFTFYLAKLSINHPPGSDGIEFRRQLSKTLNASRSDSIRVQPVVRENTRTLSIRGSSYRELADFVTEVEELGVHENGNRITRIYDKPVLCRNFAAHFYRIYFDSASPQKYIAMLVGFFDEELEADLAVTRLAAFKTALGFTILGCVILLMCLWWFVTRPIKQLTRASACIARGEFDTPLPTGNRNEIGTLSHTFALMIKEIRERNAEIRRQNEELDEKVHARTASLAEARDQLEVAVKSRDAFLATVSHELRTPLNHIYGYAQLLEISDLDDEQRSDLEKLQGSSRHLLRLVQDILDFQKIIMGRLPVNPVHCNVTELLGSIRQSNTPKAAERNNQLVLNLNGVKDRMFNDENRFRQILDNLVSNACKFTTNGTITIDARDQGEYIDIAVIDTGVGISETAIEKLFQPFSKVADSNLNPDGTGLGLVISRELARKMGGDLTMTSVPSVGSTFLVRIRRELPCESQEQFGGDSESTTTITERQPKDSESDTETPKRRTSKQVLVIDDDPNVRELMTRFLTGEGLSVIAASSGAEGIEMASRYQPSVITLDVVMPDVDGWSVLAALKANELTANIPVVLVTVLDDPEKGYTFGATDYLEKPVEGDRLANVVRRYCAAETPVILIVDDNPKDREIIRRVLKNDGCETIEAADGADGLLKFETAAIDLIVLDLLMPVMDGFTFVEEIRKLKGTRMPPIIVLTAKDMTPSNRDRLNGMVSDIVQKGEFDRRGFLQEIHRRLDDESSKQQ